MKNTMFILLLLIAGGCQPNTEVVLPDSPYKFMYGVTWQSPDWNCDGIPSYNCYPRVILGTKNTQLFGVINENDIALMRIGRAEPDNLLPPLRDTVHIGGTLTSLGKYHNAYLVFVDAPIQTLRADSAQIWMRYTQGLSDDYDLPSIYSRENEYFSLYDADTTPLFVSDDTGGTSGFGIVEVFMYLKM